MSPAPASSDTSSAHESNRSFMVNADGTLVPGIVNGLPAVDNRGQGGLLDVALDPNFIANGLIYWSYAEPRENGTNNTAVARGRLVEGPPARVDNVQVVYHQTPSLASTAHFGSRLNFLKDGTLLITHGERSITEGRMFEALERRVERRCDLVELVARASHAQSTVERGHVDRARRQRHLRQRPQGITR